MFALLGSGVIYLMLGDTLEALLLLVFASLSVGIAVIQEARSEVTLEV
jgi:Ca2+-transporting ATPase